MITNKDILDIVKTNNYHIRKLKGMIKLLEEYKQWLN